MWMEKRRAAKEEKEKIVYELSKMTCLDTSFHDLPSQPFSVHLIAHLFFFCSIFFLCLFVLFTFSSFNWQFVVRGPHFGFPHLKACPFRSMLYTFFFRIRDKCVFEIARQHSIDCLPFRFSSNQMVFHSHRFHFDVLHKWLERVYASTILVVCCSRNKNKPRRVDRKSLSTK